MRIINTSLHLIYTWFTPGLHLTPDLRIFKTSLHLIHAGLVLEEALGLTG